jgi:hypothetical protein
MRCLKYGLGTQNIHSCTAYGGHADHPVVVHIGGSRATAATNGGHAARSSFLAKGQLGAHLDGDGHEGHE